MLDVRGRADGDVYVACLCRGVLLHRAYSERRGGAIELAASENHFPRRRGENAGAADDGADDEVESRGKGRAGPGSEKASSESCGGEGSGPE